MAKCAQHKRCSRRKTVPAQKRKRSVVHAFQNSELVINSGGVCVWCVWWWCAVLCAKEKFVCAMLVERVHAQAAQCKRRAGASAFYAMRRVRLCACLPAWQEDARPDMLS